MIVSLLGNLAGQVIGLMGKKGAAKQAEIAERMQQMERSWTDEVLVVYWFSPSMIGWISPAKADAIITVMFSNPEMVTIQAAITAAVFGLGKVNGRK